MSSTDTFDLEPEHEQPPLDWQAAVDEGEHTDPTLPPPRAGLRRARHRYAASGRAAAPGEPAPTGKARYFRWLISPTVYYVIALLSALGMLFVFFNPTFGTVSRAWWFDVLRTRGPWTYEGAAASTAAALVLCIVGATIGLWLKRWRYRPAFMLLMFVVPLLSPGVYVLGPLGLYWLMGAALLGGVLLSAVRRHRRGHLFAAALLLAGLLFVPWGGPTEKSRDFSFSGWAYGSAPASETLDEDGYLSPATIAIDAFRAGGYSWRNEIPDSAALGLAMLVLGLLAWMGLGGAWVRWAAGALLLGFYTWTTAEAMASEWGGWQTGVAAWAEVLRNGAVFLLLPLAAAVSEVRAPRGR